MAIPKKDLCKTDPGVLTLDYSSIEVLVDMVEKDIDKKIKEKYKEGQPVEIYFSEYFEYPELIEEITERFENTGWRVINDGEYTITLF